MHSVPCCHLIDYFSCSKWVSIHVCPSLLPETLILSSWLKKFVPIYSSCDFLLDEKMSLVSSLWLILPVLVHHMHRIIQLSSFQSLSCVWLCDLMHCSTPGFYVLHHLPELAQTHIHWVGDAIQPSHPLLSPYPPAFNLSQHQGFFQRVSSLHQVAKVLELQLQHQFFQWIFRINSRARVWTKETDSRELCVILSYFASGILLRKKLK